MKVDLKIYAPALAGGLAVVLAAATVAVPAGGVFLPMLLGVLGLSGWWGCHRLLRDLGHWRRRAERSDALLDACAIIVEHADGTVGISPCAAGLLGIGRLDRLEDLAAMLAHDVAGPLADALIRLRETGEPLHIAVPHASRHLSITGRRSADGALLLGIQDDTDTAERLRRITAERDAALALQADLHAALDALPLPVWLRRDDLGLAWCNKAYAKAVDATPDRVVTEQRELAAGLPGALGGRALADQARDSGTAQSETLNVVIDTARRVLEATEAPLPAHGRMAGRVVGFAFDCTRLNELKAELDRHIRAHAEVLEHLGTAIVIFGADTRLKFHNRAYTRLYELDEAWLESEPGYGDILEELRLRRRLPETADFPLFKRQQLALFTKLIEAHEDLIHLPDGTALRQLTVPHPFGGLMFVFEDVTNTLALETSYNTLMAVQQETLDNLAEGIAVLGGDGRLKLHNPAFARLWDLTTADLAGEPHVARLFDRMKPFFQYGANWEKYRDDLVGSILDRSARHGRIERTDGTVVEFTTVPLPDGASLTSFLDVTDSVRVEQALRASNAALEAADRLKSEFIANVSYHLRTPLNAIMGFGQVLTGQYFGPLNDRQCDYSQYIVSASERLLALINDILDLATIEAGHMVLEQAPLSVPDLLGVVAALTREWARKQGLALVIDCPPEIGEIEADERRLKQALFNLVSNAIRFTPAGGRITLSARRERDIVIVSVSDTGSGAGQDNPASGQGGGTGGFTAADRQRVLRRFERADAGARQDGSAGLGLALVKSFIELHGGRVVTDNLPERGTTIHCILPVRPREAAPNRPTMIPTG